MPSSTSWGIGEIPDLPHMGDWINAAGMNGLMLLPVGTMGAGESSPYSACSAMAIDPIYVSVSAMEDFDHVGGDGRLSPEMQRLRDEVKASPRVQFQAVRTLKQAAFEIACERFVRDEWEPRTERASQCAAFVARERWWLQEYALFMACAREWPGGSWQEWPEAVARRDSGALAEARGHFADRIFFEQYVQWIAEGQWHQARERLREQGVALYGDLPFVVNAQSADVWSRQDEFAPEVSVGVPPDSFSATGQDWGLPMYRWDVVYRSEFAWLRHRAHRMAALYDGFRADHLVGFYRTYGKVANGDTFFSPSDEHTQQWQGEQIMRVFLESGADVVAEDLGTVPTFVRESIARLGIGGYKVLRWERMWDQPGQPFTAPADYPGRSVATTGTHDTEPVAEWWDTAEQTERIALAELFSRVGLGDLDPASPWSDALRDGLLRLMCSASSDHLILPIQDVFGWRDRINIPATVGDHNWTWRLPYAVDGWRGLDAVTERAGFLQSVFKLAQ
ncbi:MAG: 4-alpha-glucanotransferase [Acidobacteria bacterium]|nr:4-alpha-glucanotransferase [Acidobacteriota bacterium]